MLKRITRFGYNTLELSRIGTFWNILDITTPETSGMF
ncbi:hypothetical protein KSS87_018090 [Heliosperma pusillum]|nr:hypothetical protein KSS87_018090 [Heliosperma pusillum]